MEVQRAVRHLTSGEAEAYRARRLSPGELLEADRHAAACPECRAQLALPPDEARLAGALERALDGALADPGHPSDDQLEAFAEQRLASAEGEQVREHLDGCEPCASVAAAVRAEHEAAPASWALPAAAGRKAAWPRLALAGLAAAAFAAVILRSSPPGNGPSASPTPPPVVALEELRDGPRQYSRTASGWTGLTGLAESDQQALREALERGQVTAPAWLSGLRTGHGGLLGAGDKARFELSAPVGTGVDETRPRLLWTAHPQARSYTVTLLDARQELAAESPALQGTEWRPERPLPAGDYVWQVAARLPGGDEVVAPGPGEPEARFRVLDAAECQLVVAARARLEGQPLLLALALIRAGLAQEGARVLAQAAEANPKSASLAQLTRSLDVR